MPCRWSRRCLRARADGVVLDPNAEKELFQRFSHRRENIRMMRKKTRAIVLLMALMEALRVGPAQLVFAGKKGYAAPGPEDYGIAYWVGFMLSYIYMCIFTVIFVPFFSWWIPSLPSPDSSSGRCLDKAMDYLKKFDLFVLPIGIGLSLIQHIYYTLHTLIHVDSPGPLFRRPENTRRTWAARMLMFAGIGFALVFGYYAFAILEATNLARVKTLEYYLIVLPIQVNIGVCLGGVMQWKMERRILKKQACKTAAMKMEEGSNDEKEALLEA